MTNRKLLTRKTILLHLLIWNFFLLSKHACHAFSNSHHHCHLADGRISLQPCRNVHPLNPSILSPHRHHSILSLAMATSTTKSEESSPSTSDISYRKARIDDLPGIVDLLERSFDDEDEVQDEPKNEETTSNNKNGWPSWNPFQNKQNTSPQQDEVDDSSQKLVQLLQQRLTLPQHVLIVAISKGSIVGFMELGTMPAPIPLQVPINLPTGETLEETIAVRPERPFLANLAVDPNCRRNKIGFKLVQLALKIATTWESTKANEKALGFYFHPNTSSSCGEEEEEEEDKKLSTLYLSVDCDNTGAIAFYKRLEFATVLDESLASDDGDGDTASPPTNTRARGARKPKLYLEKELVLSIDDSDKQ